MPSVSDESLRRVAPQTKVLGGNARLKGNAPGNARGWIFAQQLQGVDSVTIVPQKITAGANHLGDWLEENLQQV